MSRKMPLSCLYVLSFAIACKGIIKEEFRSVYNIKQISSLIHIEILKSFLIHLSVSGSLLLPLLLHLGSPTDKKRTVFFGIFSHSSRKVQVCWMKVISIKKKTNRQNRCLLTNKCSNFPLHLFHKYVNIFIS